MRRRDFIAIAALAGLSTVSLGKRAWAIRSSNDEAHRLVVIFLRGAVDGLSVVVPHSDEAYYIARPTIAIPKPGALGGVIDLDGRFGLHPALHPVMPLWKERSLAFIHASGSPSSSRSHFDAQDFMEGGVPDEKSITDGWMNRLVQVLPGPRSITEAVAFDSTMPKILSGKARVATWLPSRAANHPLPVDFPLIEAAFDGLYKGTDSLAEAYRLGRDTRKRLLADFRQDMSTADRGAPPPQGFAADAERLARLMRRDSTVKLAFMDIGGWDTHVNQGSSEGPLANMLAPLAVGLKSLVGGLGSVFEHTTIVVMSEFGRTVHENGDGGTDHGHGNVMWVIGGGVAGGGIYGRWPGLQEDQLYEARDLAVTTDFRSVLANILGKAMRLEQRAIDYVFPVSPSPASSDAIAGLIRV